MKFIGKCIVQTYLGIIGFELIYVNWVIALMVFMVMFLIAVSE